jgi:hypothetical protein
MEMKLRTGVALIFAAVLAAPAHAAMPVAPSEPAEAPIVQVYGGCGPYGHRGPYGGCPN